MSLSISPTKGRKIAGLKAGRRVGRWTGGEGGGVKPKVEAPDLVRASARERRLGRKSWVGVPCKFPDDCGY